MSSPSRSAVLSFRRRLALQFVSLTFGLVPACLFAGVGAGTLQNGVPAHDLSGIAGSALIYKISVPPGATLLDIGTRGGKGDVDLYVKFGQIPASDDFDKVSTNFGNLESIKLNPQGQAGDWFILLGGAEFYLDTTLRARFTMGPGIVAPPVFRPGTGTFTANAVVRLSSPTDGAAIRYTTDGSNPDATSPRYTGPIPLSQTTTLKARGFKAGHVPSATAAATLTVLPENTVTELQSDVPLSGLAGSGSSDAFFHINVPSGQSKLVIQNLNGTGATDLYARSGALPTTESFDGHVHVVPARRSLTMMNPAPGDWYILLHGRRSFSDSTLKARYFVSGVDLIPWQPVVHLEISVETFSADDCDVVEGQVQAGTRRLLRFTTETRNIGDQDVVLGDPVGNPLFVFAPCHGHYHFDGYASYRLLDSGSNVVATGAKVGFCLEDVYQWDITAHRKERYTCESQGIQAGWADVYDASLGGQFIDITNVASGDYTLEIAVNPLHKIAEIDYANNVILVPVTIPPPN